MVPIWAGVGVAVVLSIGFAYGLHLLVAQEDHFMVQVPVLYLFLRPTKTAAPKPVEAP